MNPDTTKIIGDLFAHIEQAWNHADGARLAEAFTTEADFVDIRGIHHCGTAAIAQGHQAILDSIYKGSTVDYTVVSSETIADACLLGQIEATLEVPAGPLQGNLHSRITAVVLANGDGWKVRSFHNTLRQRLPDATNC